MATMIPNDIEEFTIDGEKRFYQFLEAVAKPDSEFISWYTPDIEGNEPDFLLFYGKENRDQTPVSMLKLTVFCEPVLDEFSVGSNSYIQARQEPCEFAVTSTMERFQMHPHCRHVINKENQSRN